MFHLLHLPESKSEKKKYQYLQMDRINKQAIKNFGIPLIYNKMACISQQSETSLTVAEYSMYRYWTCTGQNHFVKAALYKEVKPIQNQSSVLGADT